MSAQTVPPRPSKVPIKRTTTDIVHDALSTGPGGCAHPKFNQSACERVALALQEAKQP